MVARLRNSIAGAICIALFFPGPREAEGQASRSSRADSAPPASMDPELPWHLRAVRAPEAWDQKRSGTGVTIGLIEPGGFDILHPKL
jgi:glycine/D-amino acid oxidase-like deaminating enzyme